MNMFLNCCLRQSDEEYHDSCFKLSYLVPKRKASRFTKDVNNCGPIMYILRRQAT